MLRGSRWRRAWIFAVAIVVVAGTVLFFVLRSGPPPPSRLAPARRLAVPLHTRGGVLLDRFDRPVLMQGINWSGLATANKDPWTTGTSQDYDLSLIHI